MWFCQRLAEEKTRFINDYCRLSEDIERMKRVRLHRGLRHYWGIRVRGQHTKTTGRHRAFAAMEGGKKKWLGKF